MILIEVKSFERKIEQNREEARTLIAKDIHHFMAFFKDNIIDYNVSVTGYASDKNEYLAAIVTVRHRKNDQKTDW